jgi:hypothetical protein
MYSFTLALDRSECTLGQGQGQGVSVLTFPVLVGSLHALTAELGGYLCTNCHVGETLHNFLSTHRREVQNVNHKVLRKESE